MAPSIEVDIGFGLGHFLKARREECPEACLHGIETRLKWVQRLSRRLEWEAIDNIRLHHGDARLLLPTLFKKGQVDRFFINFPDPWWKRRHKKRQLVSSSFIRMLRELLRDGGAIYLETDVAFYVRLFMGTCETDTGLINPLGPFAMGPWDDVASRSNRSNRCAREGTPTYSCFYVKIPSE